MLRTVVSDLHIFSPKTNFKKYEWSIRCALRDSEILVLNGDIIDFHWHSEENILNSAIKWLTEIIEFNKKCHVVYILGNHDCYKKFSEELQKLSLRYSNFSWHKDFYREDECFFFHGDLIIGRKPTIIRPSLVDYEPSILGRNYLKIYESFVDSKMHHIVCCCLLKELIVPIIYKTLQKETDLSMKKVYFGHIHNSFTDYEYKGIKFSNTGSALKNSNINMIFW